MHGLYIINKRFLGGKDFKKKKKCQNIKKQKKKEERNYVLDFLKYFLPCLQFPQDTEKTVYCLTS